MLDIREVEYLWTLLVSVAVGVGVSVHCGLIQFLFLKCLVNQGGWVVIGSEGFLLLLLTL